MWESTLERAIQALGKTGVDIAWEKKSAFWKIWIASVLRRNTSAPSTWIARRLNMGTPQLVGVYVNRLHGELMQQPNPDYDKSISIHTDPFCCHILLLNYPGKGRSGDRRQLRKEGYLAAASQLFSGVQDVGVPLRADSEAPVLAVLACSCLKPKGQSGVPTGLVENLLEAARVIQSERIPRCW